MRVDAVDNGEQKVVLDEVFDFKKVDQFRKCYEQIDGSSTKVLNIDFSNTKYMDSSALGMLLNVQSYFKDHNVKIKITKANDQIKKILSISRFDQRFTIE